MKSSAIDRHQFEELFQQGGLDQISEAYALCKREAGYVNDLLDHRVLCVSYASKYENTIERYASDIAFSNVPISCRGQDRIDDEELTNMRERSKNEKILLYSYQDLFDNMFYLRGEFTPLGMHGYNPWESEKWFYEKILRLADKKNRLKDAKEVCSFVEIGEPEGIMAWCLIDEQIGVISYHESSGFQCLPFSEVGPGVTGELCLPIIGRKGPDLSFYANDITYDDMIHDINARKHNLAQKSGEYA